MKAKGLILVVDDDQGVLRLLSRSLKSEGYDVATAENGRVAMDLLARQEPALVILDIMMPELDGFQTLNLIRKQSNVPVIMLTGRGEVTVLQDTLALGADDYVRKPFSTSELMARIRAKLRRAASEVS